MSRKTEHRRSLLRNLVTSLIEKERIETTVSKAKETRPLAEWMITLAKQGDLAARRQAAAYLLNPNAVKFLFEELSKRYATRAGGYTRLVHAGWRKGDGADVAVLELVDNEVLQRLSAKRAKKVESRRKAAEEAKAQEPTPPPEEEGGEKK
jgi:large subunit ribosomal protein L17